MVAVTADADGRDGDRALRADVVASSPSSGTWPDDTGSTRRSRWRPGVARRCRRQLAQLGNVARRYGLDETVGARAAPPPTPTAPAAHTTPPDTGATLPTTPRAPEPLHRRHQPRLRRTPHHPTPAPHCPPRRARQGPGAWQSAAATSHATGTDRPRAKPSTSHVRLVPGHGSRPRQPPMRPGRTDPGPSRAQVTSGWSRAAARRGGATC